MAKPAHVAAKNKSSGRRPRGKSVHPPTSEMVVTAIKNLRERGGSSLQTIQKYIAANYNVDSDKLSPYIKKYLKAAIASGELVQTKGKEASGSFKLAAPKAKKTAASTAPARGRGRASSAPLEKNQNPTKVKAKSPEKLSVKATEKKKRASPAKAKESPTKAKKVPKRASPTQSPTKTKEVAKAPRPKTAAKAKTPNKARPKKK